MIVGCHNRSERDKDEKVFRVPAIILNQGEDVEERRRERRERWISAISRDDLNEKILNSDRICSRHFVYDYHGTFTTLIGFQHSILGIQNFHH